MKSKFSAKVCELIVALLGVIATGAGAIFKVRLLEVLGLLVTLAAVIALVARCEKHELFKVVGITIVLAVVATWVIPAGYFSGADMIESGITRIGVVDFFLTGFYSINYFLLTILFLLVLGGFYAILSKTAGYETIVNKLTKALKGKELVFVLGTSFVIALLASTLTQVWAVAVVVPFVITIILKLGLGKMLALVTTFGSMMVGLVGTTFANNGMQYINTTMSLTYTDVVWTRVGIFALAFVLFSFFTMVETKKQLKAKKSNDEDVFEIAPVKKSSKKAWPLVIVFVVVFAFLILGYLNWTEAFGVTVFDEFHTWLLGLKIGDHAVFSYILGNSAKAFGKWDLSFITTILLIASFIIALIYRVKFNDYLESFAEGLKKMLKPIFIFIMVYIVFIVCYWSPIVPVMTNWIMSLVNTFNPFLTAFVSAIAGFFHPDFGFTGYTLASYFITAYQDQAQIAAVIMPAMYGFMQFFAPTSAILMAGLAYTGVSYKSWMKYIWKFLLGLLVCFIAVFALITYM